MRAKDITELFVLGAIWGSSFMFMKQAVPEFGAITLVAVRAVGASLCLLPLVWLKRQSADLFTHWRKLLLVGIFNTALPFCLFNYAVSHIDAGLAAILNATAPMFGVLVAWLYLKERISLSAIVGVGLGFAGVLLIAQKPTEHGVPALLPVGAALGATFCYALSANYIKKHLMHAKPFAIAAGSQCFAALVLLPLALIQMPQAMPSSHAWFAALFLAFMCTGLAYVMYFDLIAKVGVTGAITVGYLVPLFGIFWGVLILDESLSVLQVSGGTLIMAGVLLATNALAMLKNRRKNPKQPE